MNNISQSKFLKHLFAIFVVGLFLVSYFLIKNQINIKGETSRKKPVLIADGYRVSRHNTNQADPEIILGEAGITVYPEDKITADLITDPSSDGGVGQKITIKRAPYFYISVDDKEVVIRSWDHKVGSILKKSGVILGPRDIISSPVESVVLPGESIVITRINVVEEEVLEDVEFQTVTKADRSVPFGQKKIIQTGEKGQNKKVYRVTYRNGAAVGRVLVSTEVSKKKVDKIVATGVVTGRANFGYYSGMVTSFYKGMKGRYLLITNLANGRSVRVKIIGSGPFNGPLVDMGTEPFQAIGGSLRDGYLPSVSIELLD